MNDYVFKDDDVISPEIYGESGHPYEAFAWLRRNDPLRMVSPTGFRPFRVVTRHADIVEIEKQPELFASEPRPIHISTPLKLIKVYLNE